ncbi:MAG: NAD(+)/NADH kinase [Candidatus Gracilibacteria bacterium]|jgi:NAD+ kinase
MSPKTRKQIGKVGLIGRKNLEGRTSYIKSIIAFLKKQEVVVKYDNRIAECIDDERSHMTVSRMMKEMDMVITLGGDGTLLKAVRELNKDSQPIVLGVHLGTLGFLTEVHDHENLISILKKIFKNKYYIDYRALLRVTVYRNNQKYKTFLALNDAVINQGNFARLIELSVKIDQRKMIDFKADGVIVATPTGSTGHSLSAGGPIIHPQLQAFIVTPICPSTLSNRPIAIPNNRQLNIKIKTERRFEDNDIGLTLDGQIILPLKYGDEIKIRKSSRDIKLIRISGKKYYKTLRDKLGWGR